MISNCKKQNLLAEFSAWTDQTNMLEGLEYTIGENTPEMTPNMAYYYLSDAKSRETLGQETIGYENTSLVKNCIDRQKLLFLKIPVKSNALNTVQKHRPNGRCLNTGFIKNGSSYTTHKYAKYPA